MATASKTKQISAEQRQAIMERYRVPAKNPAAPTERAAAARRAMSGVQLGFRVTKASYRP